MAKFKTIPATEWTLKALHLLKLITGESIYSITERAIYKELRNLKKKSQRHFQQLVEACLLEYESANNKKRKK